MFRNSSGPRYLGLAAFLAACLCAANLEAQPDGPKKGKGPKEAPKGELTTVRGTVKAFTTAPKGEVDGATLTDGTCIHWPPHLANRFSEGVAKGDKIRVVGFMETGPEGDSKVEVSSLTNLRTNRTIENPDRPAPTSQGAQSGGIERRLQMLEERIDDLSQEVRRLKNR